MDQLYSPPPTTTSAIIHSDFSSNTDVEITSVSNKESLNNPNQSLTTIQDYSNMSPSIKTGSLDNNLIPNTSLAAVRSVSIEGSENNTAQYLTTMQNDLNISTITDTNLNPNTNVSALSSLSIGDNLNVTLQSVTILEKDGNMSASIDNTIFPTTDHPINISHQQVILINNTSDDTYLFTSASDDIISLKTTDTYQPSTFINDNNMDQIIQSTSRLW